MTEDEKAIRKLVDEWMAATKAGDKETVLGLIAEDVIFMTPFGPPFGKKEFAGEPGDGDMPEVDGESEILEMEIVGDRAWIRNRIKVAVTPRRGGETKKMSGQTLTLLRKEKDGKWRLFRDANLVTPEG